MGYTRRGAAVARTSGSTDTPLRLMARRRQILFVAAALVACDQEAALRRFTPPDADSRARAYLDLLVGGHTDSAAARLIPSLATTETRQVLDSMAVLLRGQVFDSTRVIGAHQNIVNGVRHLNLSYEQRAQAGWFLTNVATVDSAGDWAVEGFSARPIAHPLEDDARFTFAGKSARHFFWLAATIACAALSL